MSDLFIETCGPSTEKCLCQCPDGPCAHVWDGPDEEWQEGSMFCSSVTCSKCGATRMQHDLWVGP